MAGRRRLVLCMGNESDGSGHKAALESHGYEVVAVSSVREALSPLTRLPVDAVVVDVDMLGIDYSVVIRHLKNTKSHIPLLLLVSAFTKMPPTRFPEADAVVFKTGTYSRLTGVLDGLLADKHPFFTRWFENWKHRTGA